ncbi:MAG: hypothetical protein QOE45_1381 [Frankiaceae bacterium]|jgi:hypothetical protein|nr:hypothetical protein [Frankiaceae bacterium]
MPTLSRTAAREAATARDQVAPALQKAQETLTDTVLPAVRDALAIAREKSGELLDSDAALEAKRRGRAVVKAAMGDTAVVPKARRWRFALGMIAIGSGIGYGFAWLGRRAAGQAGTDEALPSFETTGTEAASSSTAGSNGSAPAGGADEEIDLSAGSPSKT